MSDKEFLSDQKSVKALQSISLISGLFVLLVSLLLIFGYLQLRFTAPLDNPVLVELKEQFDRDQTNEELKEQIRTLDLMARGIYFSSTWQARTGSWLLLLGILIFLTAQRLLAARHKTIPSYPGEPVGDAAVKGVQRGTIIYSSAAVVLLALVLSMAMRGTLPSPAPVVISDLSEEAARLRDEAAREPQPERDVAATEEVAETTPAQPDEEAAIAEADVEREAVALPAEVEPHEMPSPGEIYPFFRGEGSRGFAAEAEYPLEWDGASGHNVLWKVETPRPGFNSPVVWGQRLFVTGADEDGEEIFCYDVDDGSLLWRVSPRDVRARPSQVPEPDDETGLAAPSAAVNSRFVCAIFATGNIICADHDGNVIWTVGLGIPENHYGHSSSLIIWNNLLLVQFDTNEGASLKAFDLESGEMVWETERETLISWASPVLATIGGVEQVILTSHPYLAGYNPATGEELWRARGVTGEVGPSVAVNSTTVFAGNEYATVVAVDPSNTDEPLWEDNELLPEVASLAATDEYLFVATSFGAIGCYGAASGELLWEHYYDYGFYSSPIIVGDKVYITDMVGVTYIFRVAGEFEEIASSQLGERVLTTPAFAHGRIFIRGSSNLYSIGER